MRVHVGWGGRWLVTLWFLLTVTGACAQAPLQLGPAPLPEALGPYALYWRESGPGIDLTAARRALEQGAFKLDARPVASLGIGSAPVWVRLAVFNPAERALDYELTAGMTWIDQVDVYLVQHDRVLSVWRGGDGVPGADGVVPAQGQTTLLHLPPGASEIFVRAATDDPLALPLALRAPAEARHLQDSLHTGYGLFYGFLLACMVFNAILFAALRARTSLFYGVYLSSFLLMSVSYTGHGLAWWWPGHVEFQRFVILVGMVMFSSSGLVFATRFLDLDAHAPRVRQVVDRLCLAVLGLMAVFVLSTHHAAAALLAFVFMVCATVGMVGLGIWALKVSPAAGRYFLGAAVCGATGTAATALCVWGWLPMMTITYRGIEIGVLLEATLLAVALALRAREVARARHDAERLARTDALTGLANRRDFLERAEREWAVAVRRSRPISALALDIDHFKTINDRYGHDAGDTALKVVARLLTEQSRTHDIVARWGGEEFVVLLPDTDAEQATALAERLRAALVAERWHYQGQAVELAASFGVAQRHAQESVAALLAEADQWLYFAKRTGRNRVAASTGQVLSA